MKFPMKKILVLLFFTASVSAQNLFDVHRKWILPINDMDGNEIYITPYDSSKIALNTMILEFKKGGKIDYDYQSTVEACAGVNFLDLDVEKCSWSYLNGIFTLKIRGGYASIDDFNFKRDYKIFHDEMGDVYLRKIKTHYYQKRKRDPDFVE
jgi:hypothetical protein